MHHRLPSLLCSALLLTGCSLFTGSAEGLNSEKLTLEVWQIINRDYVDGTFGFQDWDKARQTYLEKAKGATTADETYQVVNQLVTSVKDPYTRFLNPKDFSALQSQVKGELSGVGLQITQTDKKIVVISPVTGSPAFRAGIKPADEITGIDGVTTVGMDIDKVAQKLRGPVGSKVTIKLQRAKTAFEVTVVRDNIEINPVSYSVKTFAGKKLGYIGLRAFNGNAATEVKKALNDLERQQVKGYILDLRFNPGGLVIEGVEIARFFLPAQQTIVSTVSRQGIRDTTLSSPTGPLTTKPVTILVNGGTASASEILSGALQDNKRAQLIGTKTFGKGLIQQVYTLSDGSGLTVSIARYQTPSGRDIHKVGIPPNVAVDLPLDIRSEDINTPRDPQFATAAKLLLKNLSATLATN
jgi:carboxyl-terminal processing protease